MTPYQRTSARLAAQRDAENAEWAARGDTRVVGLDAHERMSRRMRARVRRPTVASIIEQLFSYLPPWLRTRGRRG